MILEDKELREGRFDPPAAALCPDDVSDWTMVIVRIHADTTQEERVLLGRRIVADVSSSGALATLSYLLEEAFPQMAETGVIKGIPPAPGPITEGQGREWSEDTFETLPAEVAADGGERHQAANGGHQVGILIFIPLDGRSHTCFGSGETGADSWDVGETEALTHFVASRRAPRGSHRHCASQRVSIQPSR
jgi:hypothetical protein